MVAPDTSLSPTAFFLSFLFFFLLQTSPSPFSLGWLHWPSSPIAAPPPLGAAGRLRRAASLRPDSGKRKLGAPGSRPDCQPRGCTARAPGSRSLCRRGCSSVPGTRLGAASSPARRGRWRWWPPALPRCSRAPPKFGSRRRGARRGVWTRGRKFCGVRRAGPGHRPWLSPCFPEPRGGE